MGRRTIYDAAARSRAAELYDEGYGVKAIADSIHVPYEAVRKWIDTYRSVGIEGLMAMGRKYARHSFETKLAAARAVVDGGMTRADAMARFGIASTTPLKDWVRAYREGGPEALRPKPKGRPRGAGPAPARPTREQELERRIRKLEAENAYLKKSIALKAEKRSRTARRQRP